MLWELLILRQGIGDRKPGRLGSHVNVMIRCPAGGIDEHPQGHVNVLTSPDGREQEREATTAPGAIAVRAFTFQQQVFVPRNDGQLLYRYAGDGSESGPRACPAA